MGQTLTALNFSGLSPGSHCLQEDFDYIQSLSSQQDHNNIHKDHDHIHMHCVVNGVMTEAGSFFTVVVSVANSKQEPCTHNAQCTALHYVQLSQCAH